MCACLLWFNDRDEAGSHHSRWQQKPSVLLLIINPAGSVPATVLTQLEERYGWGFPLKELTYPSADGQFHHCSAHFCQKRQQNDLWHLVFPYKLLQCFCFYRTSSGMMSMFHHTSCTKSSHPNAFDPMLWLHICKVTIIVCKSKHYLSPAYSHS